MDAIAEWTAAQARVVALVEDLDAEQADLRVPACPDWAVRDLLSHMIGLDADVLGGDEPEDHNAEWTGRQVTARAGRDVGALLDEWRALTEPLQTWMAQNSTRPLGDVIIHEQDLRGALGRPGAKDTEGLAALRDRMAGAFDGAVRKAGLPAAQLVGPDWRFLAGDGEPGVSIGAPTFELTRMLMSRRSAAQIRRWVSSGDVEPYLDCLTTLGPLPTAALTE